MNCNEKPCLVLAHVSFLPLKNGDPRFARLLLKAMRCIHKSGLKYKPGTGSTAVVGTPDQIFNLVRECQKKLYKPPVERLITTITMDQHPSIGPDEIERRIETITVGSPHRLK